MTTAALYTAATHCFLSAAAAATPYAVAANYTITASYFAT